MIKVNTSKRTVRETRCAYKYVGENGEAQTADIRVRYFAATTRELKESFEQTKAAFKAAKDSEEPYLSWYSDKLLKRLESLPDLVDEETGEPFEITIEFLDALEADNVRAMVTAIEEDENPKSESPSAA
jgi:hypothetical protein